LLWLGVAEEGRGCAGEQGHLLAQGAGGYSGMREVACGVEEAVGWSGACAVRGQGTGCRQAPVAWSRLGRCLGQPRRRNATGPPCGC